MKTNHGRYGVLGVAVVALVLGVLGRPARAEEIVERKVGVGYKIGNGMGFEGGDLIYRAFPHVSVDPQVGYYGSKAARANYLATCGPRVLGDCRGSKSTS
jgi:hypothetical protein